MEGKAAIWGRAHGPLEIREDPVPDVKPGGILLKLNLANICSSDIHFVDGRAPRLKGGIPQILGHEMMGTILKLDNDVRTDSLGQPLRGGDRLVYSYYSPSGGDQQDHGLRPVRPADPRGAGVLRSRRSTVRTFATGCRRSVKSKERGEASQNSDVRHPDMPAFDPAVKGWTMAGDAEKVVSQKFCPRFGMLAVEMGYVSVEQVREAMAQQIDDDFANRPHRLLGTILVDKGWMTFREVEMVLEKLFTLQQR